jgi:4-hydroxy-2-oxoheptanedioate aldolase
MNRLRERLAKGETLLGIWSIIPSAPLVATLASTGVDFLILDCEHGGHDLRGLDG